MLGLHRAIAVKAPVFGAPGSVGSPAYLQEANPPPARQHIYKSGPGLQAPLQWA